MSWRELRKWAHYARVEPFGEARADFRNAQQMALLANINRDPKQRSESYTAADFMPDFDREPEPVNVEQEGATVHPETLAFLFGMAHGQIRNRAAD